MSKFEREFDRGRRSRDPSKSPPRNIGIGEQLNERLARFSPGVDGYGPSTEFLKTDGTSCERVSTHYRTHNDVLLYGSHGHEPRSRHGYHDCRGEISARHHADELAAMGITHDKFNRLVGECARNLGHDGRCQSAVDTQHDPLDILGGANHSRSVISKFEDALGDRHEPFASRSKRDACARPHEEARTDRALKRLKSRGH